MKLNTLCNIGTYPNFGALKFQNHILKYEHEIECVKKSQDMKDLVNYFEHKGMDVFIKFNEETHTTFDIFKAVPWSKGVKYPSSTKKNSCLCIFL